MIEKITFFLLCSLFIPVALAVSDEIMLDDFNGKTIPMNSLRKETGAWSSEPAETGKACKMSFGRDASGLETGASLRIEYNVEGSNRERMPMCGYWTRVSLDLSTYKYLRLSIRGDEDAGFPRVVILEMKDQEYKTGQYRLEGITSKWQEFTVPLAVFRGVDNWSKAFELGILFHESMQRQKGALFFDNIRFIGGDDSKGSAGFASPEASRGIIADGDASEWNKRELTELPLDGKTNLEYGEINGRTDLSAVVYSQRDDKFVYFLVEVADNELAVVDDPAQVQDSDGVTFFFDSKKDGYDMHSEDNTAVLILPDGRKQLLYEDYVPSDDEVRAGIMTQAGKYIMEAAFAWEFLGIDPQLSKDIGVSVAVQDLDITPKLKKGRINWTFELKPGQIRLGILDLTTADKKK